MGSIDYGVALDDSETGITIEEMFIAEHSSSRYEVRLFFPDTEFDVGSDEFTNLARDIVRSHHGLLVRLEDRGIEISRCEYDSVTARRDYAFNTNDPLSVWLGSGLSLRRGNAYTVHIDVPASVGEDSIKTILVMGAGYSPWP